MRLLLLSVSFLLLVSITVSAETWTVACETYAPPYNYRIENGKPNPQKGMSAGLDVELVDAVMKALNIKYRLLFLSWNDVVKVTKNNTVDFSFQWKAHPSRFDNFLIIGPLRTGRTVFAVPAASNIRTYQNFSDLQTFPIGTIKGYLYTPEFDLHTGLIKDDSASDYHQLVQNLLNGKTRMIIGDLNSIIFTSRQLNGQKDIRILPKIVKSINRYAAFNKSQSEKAGLFAHGLNLIKHNGTYDKIIERWR